MMFIKGFHATIYPFFLWVAVEPTFEEFSKRFQRLDWNMKDAHEFTKEDFEGDDYQRGVTHIVKERETGVFGACIRVVKPNAVCADFCAHEGSHVCDFMCDVFDICGFTYDLGEPRAYITGWVADCIEKTVGVWKECQASDKHRSIWHEVQKGDFPEIGKRVLVQDCFGEYHVGELTNKGWSVETWVEVGEPDVMYWQEIY